MRAFFNIIWLLVAFAAVPVAADTIQGTVSYPDSTPAPGVTVYALGSRQRLAINNNIIMSADHIRRGYSDADGAFTITDVNWEPVGLIARDFEERAVYLRAIDANEPVKLVLGEPASITVTFMQDREPIAGTKITGSLLTGSRSFRSSYSAVTDKRGGAHFRRLAPGDYRFEIRQEVPQVGCSFRSVALKAANVSLTPGQGHMMIWGNSGLPSLHGTVTDSQGDPLHGVWVRLLPGEPNDATQQACGPPPEVVWADVTERDGSYSIYDIPAGVYTLCSFRRLALNNYSRTLSHSQKVVIAPVSSIPTLTPMPAQTCNVAVDVSPFMPLAYGQPAPSLAGTLLSGVSFDLTEHAGKAVVVHFYVTSSCGSKAAPTFDRLLDEFASDKVVVVGVCLDKEIATCKEYVAEKELRHGQIYDGPWPQSQLVKDFRVVNVPSSFVIDPDGNIAQIDLFQDVLIGFVRELLGRHGLQSLPAETAK